MAVVVVVVSLGCWSEIGEVVELGYLIRTDIGRAVVGLVDKEAGLCIYYELTLL